MPKVAPRRHCHTYNVLANTNFQAICPVGTIHLASRPNPKDGLVNLSVTALNTILSTWLHVGPLQ